MDEPKRVIHSFNVDADNILKPVANFMELACQRMTQEMARETHNWEGLQRLETRVDNVVEDQRDEIRELKTMVVKANNQIETLMKLMSVKLVKLDDE